MNGAAPAASLLEEVACDLCRGADVEVLRPAVSNGPARHDLPRIFSASSAAPLTERLVRCRACSLVFVSPRVQGRAIVAAYGEGEDAVFADQARARERTFEASLERMEALGGGPGLVFDVGTATGSFLATAVQRGWSADGCDPNAWLASWGARRYGLAIRTGTLETLDLAAAHYDAVTLWDVVEHLPSPSAAIERAGALLKPDGFLFLTFPDISSASARALGMRWPLLRAMHLYYFSRATMGRLLSQSGFEVVIMEAHTPMLEVGYLVERGADALGLPGRALAKLAYLAGAGPRHVPVRMGQAFVAARRLRV